MRAFSLNDSSKNSNFVGQDNFKPSSASSSTFEATVLSEFKALKEGQRVSVEKQLMFEERMEKKWRLFVEDMRKKQRQTPTLNIGQPQELEPLYDDFEDLDENFPIKAKHTVEDFESALRTDLNFKLRLVIFFF